MFISDLTIDKLTDRQMSNLLFSGIEDDHKKGDCIFVAGSSRAIQYRLPKAVELYNEGRSRKVLFSGGVTWNASDYPEAVALKNEAIILGIPEKDILVEDRSQHTLENVLASLLVLNRAFHLYNIKRLLVVTNAYHMRRLHLTLQTYMPSWIKFTMCPAADNSTTKDNWFLTEVGRKRVKEECGKIIQYVQKGALEDQEVRI